MVQMLRYIHVGRYGTWKCIMDEEGTFRAWRWNGYMSVTTYRPCDSLVSVADLHSVGKREAYRNLGRSTIVGCYVRNSCPC